MKGEEKNKMKWSEEAKATVALKNLKTKKIIEKECIGEQRFKGEKRTVIRGSVKDLLPGALKVESTEATTRLEKNEEK